MDEETREWSKCLELLNNICKDNVGKLFKIWKVVGHPKIEDKVDIVCHHIQQIFNDMVAEENNDQQILAEKIEGLLKEASNLCHDIGRDYKQFIADLEDPTLPLLLLEKQLSDRLKGLQECKEERVNRYEQLLKEEHVLCFAMGLKERAKLSKFPQEEDLEEFRAYIMQMENKQKHLKQLYMEKKQIIDCITVELGISPKNSFHRMLIEVENVCLSSENMKILEDLQMTMEQEREFFQAESVKLREKVLALWDRLNVGNEKSEEFFKEYPGYSKRSIEALKTEIEFCEEKKRQNLPIFVNSVREELSRWWDKCCFGLPQRQEFQAFYLDTTYSEDILQLHEDELEKLKKYFNDNINILNLARKHGKLSEKMVELHERSRDPSRLFANRGGQLLQEEKERKVLQKDLPIIEKELIKLLDAYEEKTNLPFLYNGENLKEKLQLKWDSVHKRKDDRKLAQKIGNVTNFTSKRKITGPSNAPSITPCKVLKITPANTPLTFSKNITQRKANKEHLENRQTNENIRHN